MAIVQISKIQHRSGNLVDLPQLDEAEFGFASDAKRVFIGKTQSGLENIEVLTSYSEVSFSQIDGAVGNLNIASSVSNGEVLSYDGTNWVNKGGEAGGYIDLGDVSNLSIRGGSIGYVLETDGLGNLSWTSKGTTTAFIENIIPGTTVLANVSSTSSVGDILTVDDTSILTAGDPVGFSANIGGLEISETYFVRNVVNGTTLTVSDSPALSANVTLSDETIAVEMFAVETTVVTTEDNILVNKASVTITDVPGMTEINGGTYFVDVLTSNTFSLYADVNLTIPINTASFSAFPFTSVTATTAATNTITVGDSSIFALNIPVKFLGDVSGTKLDNITTFYIKTKPSSTTITVSDEIDLNGVAGNVFSVNNITGLSANVFGTGGRLVSPLGVTGGSGAAQGANGAIQFNDTGILSGTSELSWSNVTPGVKTLSVTGNANITGNVNVTGPVTATRLVSNVATGTAPLQVNSTNRVANLNVAYSNVSDNSVVGNLTTGNYFPALVSTSTTGNKALNVSGNYVFDTANAKFVAGNIVATYDVQGSTLTGSITTNAQPNITSVGTLTSLTVSGNANAGNVGATNFVGSGASLSSLNASNLSSGTVPSARLSGTYTITVSGSATTAGTVTTNAQPNITSVGTLTSLAVTGNASAGNISTGGALSVTGNANVGNIGATNGVFTSVSGNGAGLTGLNASNLATGTVPSARLSGTYTITVSGSATTAGTVTTNAQPNITSVGTLTSLNVTNSITAGNVFANSGTVRATTLHGTALTTGANTTAGTITGNWTLTAGSRLQATYADLAEYYEGDQIYEAGTVLEFGGEKEVTLAKEETSRLAGVVSTNPAYIMNSDCSGDAVAIALQGRCPVKVKGPVYKGDMMVSAGNGYAKAVIISPKIGTVLGKALENFEGTEGVIEIAVGRL
jgi:hypothetical protein